MSLTNPNTLVSASFSGKNVSAGASVYTYTGTSNVWAIISFWAGVAGSGDYIVWLTNTWAGIGTAHDVVPHTTITLGATTDLCPNSIIVDLFTGDVINIMVDGLAGDISISGSVRISALNSSVFEASDTVAHVTLVDTTTTVTNAVTVANMADAVWDELLPGHVIAGSAGVALSAAGLTADPLLNAVPGVYVGGTAGAALGRIGSGQIITTSIVAQSGNVATYRGDDYNNTDARRIEWTDVSANWPTLTAATILIVVGGDVSFAGTVITATGASKKVGVELTAAQTSTIPQGELDFVVVAALSSGRVVTLVEGKWTSKKQLTVGS